MREASCGGVRACLARVDERGKESAQQARAAVTTLTHKSATGNTPPLASPETVQYCLQQYRDTTNHVPFALFRIEWTSGASAPECGVAGGGDGCHVGRPATIWDLRAAG